MDGIINVNKPKGITSYDVIRKLKKILKMKKIGHTGTLDPLAQGVLVICLGKATKLASEIESKTKKYKATMELGYSTTSYDIEGEIVNKVDNVNVQKSEIENIISEFLGEQEQIPPMFSAVKVNGKKLYELARQNIEIERKARKIKINEIELVDFDGNKNIVIDTKVSKGTYIRTLIDDIGKKLGTYATMTGLVREEVGEYTIKDSFSLEKMTEMAENNDFSFVTKIEEIFGENDEIILEKKKDIKLFNNGNTIINIKKDGKYRIYAEGIFLGIGEIKKERLKGYKYFGDIER
ncbi:MAG: tRNA pseudouridine(55) synthase TruB [Fusobacteriia bacterium 4572_132]|nr:MAG: tRNA pseudouridine(55) synthase TruB [Fusobacteriia bacterium 4572_132]